MRHFNTNYQHGFFRVGCAINRGAVGNVRENLEHHIKLGNRAQELGVDFLLYPELSLTKFTCGKLFQDLQLQRNAYAASDALMRASRNWDCFFLYGMPVKVGGLLFNGAVAGQRGKRLGVGGKTMRPNYGPYIEKRFFHNALDATENFVDFGDERVPFSPFLRYQAEEFPEIMLFAEICEMVWGAQPLSGSAALAGANGLFNLSASHEIIGKRDYRRQLISQQSSRCHALYAYCSSAWESATDLYFGGHRLIGENGYIIAESPDENPIDDDLLIVDVDFDRFSRDRAHDETWSENIRENREMVDKFLAIEPIRFHLDRKRTMPLQRHVDAYPFVPSDPAKLDARCNEVLNIKAGALAAKLDDVQAKSGKADWPDVYFGFSGGSDSTLIAVDLHHCFKKRGKDLKKVHAIAMPGYGTTQESNDLAKFLADGLGFTFEVFDIRPMVLEQFLAENYKPFGIDLKALVARTREKELQKLLRRRKLGKGALSNFDARVQKAVLAAFEAELKSLPEGANDLHFENTQASARTKVLMDKGFTIGTGDLTELWLGWCTNHGDKNSHYALNIDVAKTLVKFIIRWAADKLFEGMVREWLQRVAARDDSPELLPVGEDGKNHQSSQAKLGSYDAHDFFMYYLGRWGKTKQTILYLAKHAQFKQQFTDEQLERWIDTHFERYISQQFKANNLPEGILLGSISKSPRADHQMPGDASVETLNDQTQEIASLGA